MIRFRNYPVSDTVTFWAKKINSCIGVVMVKRSLNFTAVTKDFTTFITSKFVNEN